jgi:hypothetical protein
MAEPPDGYERPVLENDEVIPRELVWSDENEPGIRRRRAGNGFAYRTARGGRASVKFERLVDFATALPKIRAQVAHDLALGGMPKAKVVATVIRLLESTLVRVGNEEYARDNGSYGLTTLRNRHAKVTPSTLRLVFKAKQGKAADVTITDRRLVRVVQPRGRSRRAMGAHAVARGLVRDPRPIRRPGTVVEFARRRRCGGPHEQRVRMNYGSSEEFLTVAIHQATGMIAAQADCDIDEAFNRLNIRAAAMGQSVQDTALDILDRRIRFYK